MPWVSYDDLETIKNGLNAGLDIHNAAFNAGRAEEKFGEGPDESGVTKQEYQKSAADSEARVRTALALVRAHV